MAQRREKHNIHCIWSNNMYVAEIIDMPETIIANGKTLEEAYANAEKIVSEYERKDRKTSRADVFLIQRKEK